MSEGLQDGFDSVGEKTPPVEETTEAAAEARRNARIGGMTFDDHMDILGALVRDTDMAAMEQDAASYDEVSDAAFTRLDEVRDKLMEEAEENDGEGRMAA